MAVGTNAQELNTQKFVVTGCGRSGTTYTTSLLQALGVDAQHEAFFPFVKRRAPGVFYNRAVKGHHWGRLDWGDYRAEVAWQAAPFLRWIDPKAPVLHQVRHPAQFVRSRIAKGITHADLRDRYTRIRIGGQSAVGLQQAPLEIKIRYLALFWARWNDLVIRNARGPYLCVRVEDLAGDQLMGVLDHVGVVASPQAVAAAQARVATNTNTRAGGPSEVDWSVLRADERRVLDQACARYGYTL